MASVFTSVSKVAPTLQILRQRNYIALFAHLVTLIALVTVYFTMPQTHKIAKMKFYRYSIAEPYSTCTSTGQESATPGQCTVDIAYKPPVVLGSFNVMYGVWGFFAITILAHLFYATDAFGKGWYSDAVLNKGWNPYRWLEYALSASLMSFLIGIGTGTRDFNHLISFVLSTASLMSFGYIVESCLKSTNKSLDKSTLIVATIGGWVLLLSMWIPLLINFGNIVNDVKTKYKDIRDEDNQRIRVPEWIWFIILIQFLNFSSFGLIQIRQIFNAFKGMPSQFASVENAYTSLSFAGKLALASGLGYGILFRGRSCPQ